MTNYATLSTPHLSRQHYPGADVPELHRPVFLVLLGLLGCSIFHGLQLAKLFHPAYWPVSPQVSVDIPDSAIIASRAGHGGHVEVTVQVIDHPVLVNKL